MAYSPFIYDEDGKPVKASLSKDAPPAEYFAGCVALAIDLLNGGYGMNAQFNAHFKTSMIHVDPSISSQTAFVMFLGTLHEHTAFAAEIVLQPGHSLYPFFQKIAGLMQLKITEGHQEFVDLLCEFKMPGISSVKILKHDKQPLEKKADGMVRRFVNLQNFLSDNLTNLDLHFVDKTGHKHGSFKINKKGVEYLSDLSDLIGFYNKETKQKIIAVNSPAKNKVFVQIGWLEQLDDKALKELSENAGIKLEDLKKLQQVRLSEEKLQPVTDSGGSGITFFDVLGHMNRRVRKIADIISKDFINRLQTEDEPLYKLLKTAPHDQFTQHTVAVFEIPEVADLLLEKLSDNSQKVMTRYKILNLEISEESFKLLQRQETRGKIKEGTITFEDVVDNQLQQHAVQEGIPQNAVAATV